MPSKSSSSTFARIAALVLIVALAGGVYIYREHLPFGLGGAPSAAGGAPAGGFPPTSVYVATATNEKAVITAVAVGSLAASDAVTIAPELPGRLTALAVDQGQLVTKGTLLAQQDDAIYAATIAESQADMKLEQANAERAKNLMAKGAGTPKALDEATAALSMAQATLRSGQANAAKTRLTAPFDGVLGLRQVSVGEYLTAGQPIITLTKLDPIYADFALPQVDLATARVGQHVELITDAIPDRTFSGEILAIDPNLDPAARSVRIRAVLANPDLVLHPGTFVTVTAGLRTIDSALMIPEQALVPRGDRNFVYLVADLKTVKQTDPATQKEVDVQQGTAKFVPVEIGIRQIGKVEITKGLKEGDVVVTDGQMKLRPDAPVAVAKP